MSTLLQDLHFGYRMLIKTPVVSLVSALSLALGIAAASAMFALASSFFLEPLPFGEQDGLAMLQELQHGDALEQAAMVSAPNFRDMREATTAFADMTAYDIETANITGVDQPEQLQIVLSMPNLFDVLQVQPTYGRGFRAEEAAEGLGNVLVLTHQYWERKFQLDPEILGRTLALNGTHYTVVGVMPESFEMLPADVQGFRPVDIAAYENRASKGWISFGRLRPDATVEQAQAEMSAVQQRLEAEYPEANRGWGVLVREARAWFPGPTDTKLILLLIVVSIFGLAIACANVANLLLGRAEIRMKEVAVRTALGAGRARVLRQLLTESTLLALIAAVVGTFLSYFVVKGLQGAMPAMLPRAWIPTLDIPTLAATVLVAMGAGIFFGLAPALHATRGSLRESLGEGSRGGTASRSRKRLRNIFVVGEVAVALAVLSGAGFLTQAMNVLINSPSGINDEGLLTFELVLPRYKYPEAESVRLFGTEALRELAAIPGVESVALMGSLPRSRANPRSTFQVEGQEELEANEQPVTDFQQVNPDYFGTLGIPLRSGRLLEEGDRDDAALVAVVNREFVQQYLGEEEALGQRIEILGESREIVGVVDNITQARLTLDGQDEAGVYLPVAQVPRRNPRFAIRTSADPTMLSADVRSAIWSVDPDQPIALIRTLEDHIQEQMAGPQFMGVFVFALGGLAMILSAIGIYGVMAHNVIQERREIGIRLALGAEGGRVVRMVTRRGLILTGIGLAAGTPLAFVVYRGVLSALNLFEVQLSPSYSLMAGSALVVVAMLASYLPARRAATVDPVRAMQAE